MRRLSKTHDTICEMVGSDVKCILSVVNGLKRDKLPVWSFKTLT